MALFDVPLTDTLIITRNIIASIAAIHNLILLIFHLFHTFSCCKQEKNKTIRLQNLSVACLCSLCVYAIFSATMGWYKYTSSLQCKWIIKIGMTLWSISKLIVYLFIMERLFIIFQKTSLGFTKLQKNRARILFALYTVGIIGGSLSFGDGTYHPSLSTCNSNISPYIIILAGFLDLAISSLISILFARKLLIINLRMIDNNMNVNRDQTATSNQESNNKNNSTHDINNMDSISPRTVRVTSVYDLDSNDATYKILTKSTLLTLIAILSTQSCLITTGIIGSNAMWACIDSVINGWCCMLMFVTYNNLYSKLCWKMEQCVTIRCLSCYSCNYWCCELQFDQEIKCEKNTKSSPKNTTTTTQQNKSQSNWSQEIITDLGNQSPTIKFSIDAPRFEDVRSDSTTDDDDDEQEQKEKENKQRKQSDLVISQTTFLHSIQSTAL